MTVKEAIDIVCASLDEVGISPGGDCADWVPSELGIEGPNLDSLFGHIDKAMKAKGCTVILGDEMWEDAESVKHFAKNMLRNAKCK